MSAADAAGLRPPTARGGAGPRRPARRPRLTPGRLPGAMLVRRNAFLRVGYFNHAIGEVLDWILRAEELGLKSRMLSEVVLKRRLHRTNSVVLNRDSRIEYARYLKASLDRRRKTDRSENKVSE